MKTATLSETKNAQFNARTFVFLITLGLILAIFSANGFAQEGQLSLADTLTGLRSKKVSLDERNKLLAEAIRKRGVTFTLSPEIEKELSTTGADKALIDVIREKTQPAKIAVANQPKQQPSVNPVPVSTPAPPDFAYYQKRAGTYVVKGEYDLAIADYTKSIELNNNDSSTFLNRGLAYFNKKNYDKALLDFNLVIQMNPKESAAFFARGNLYDIVGNPEKAITDLQVAVDLDPANELAKSSLKRLKDDQAAKAAATAAAIKPPAPEIKQPVVENKQPAADTTAKTAASKPESESIDLGQLTSAMATRMVTPIYSAIAVKAGASGRVTVQVTLDEAGNVISAKAIDGHQFLRQSSEDAARRSKFKPAMFNNHPIKATGTIVYNYSKPTE
jgi:TonB family C-terminal domain